MSIRTELKQLFDEQTGLRCIAPFVRPVLQNAVDQVPDELLAEWRDQVRLVAKYIEPLAGDPKSGTGHPHFQAVCQQLSQPQAAQQFAAAIGVNWPEEFGPITWLQWAEQTQPQLPVSLYCVANLWLSPVPLQSATIELFAHALALASQPLRLLSRYQQAVGLLETFLQIDADSFADSQTLATQLAAGPLSQIGDAGTQSNTLLSLATALSFAGGRGDRHSTMLLEAFLQIDAHSFADPQTLSTQLAAGPLSQIGDAVTHSNALISLANALRFVEGRGPRHSAMLMEAFLQIDENSFADPHTLATHLAAGPFSQIGDAVTQSNTLRSLANALILVEGRGPRHSAMLMEAFLQIDAHSFADPHTLATQLAAGPLSQISGAVTRSNTLQSLADPLRQVEGRGPRHGAMLMEAFLQIDEGSFADPHTLATQLAAGPLSQISGTVTQSNTLRALANALILVEGRGPRHSAMLLEAFLQIDAHSFADPHTLATQLADGPLSQISGAVTRSNTLRALANALIQVEGRGRDATMLIEILIGDDPVAFGSAPKLATANASTHLQLIQTWLRAAGPEHPRALDVCEAVTEFIRNTREQHLPTYQQRQDFLNHIRGISGDLKRTGTALAAAARNRNDVATAETIERRMEEWAEEFVNRSVLEQMLNQFDFVGDDGTPPDLAGGNTAWPWPTDAGEPWRPDNVRPGWLDHFDRGTGPLSAKPNNVSNDLPQPSDAEKDDTQAHPSCENPAGVLLNFSESLPLDIKPAQPAAEAAIPRRRELTPAEQQQRDRLRQLAAEPADMSKALPESAVLIRGFVEKEDDRVVWTAWQRRSDNVRQVARWTSTPGAGQRLHIANLAFDMLVESIWNLYGRPPGKTLNTADADVLRELATAARSEGADNTDDHCELIQSAAAALQTLATLGHTDSDSPGAFRLQWTMTVGSAMLQQLQGKRPGKIATDLCDAFVRVVDLAETCFHSQQVSATVLLRQHLDAATARHIDAAAADFDLRPLFAASSGISWDDTDVMFQLEGSLWTLPTAWLPSDDGRPVYQRVASTSCVISRSLRRLAEQRALAADNNSDITRLLSAHWLEPEDRNRMVGLANLHAALGHLQDQYNMQLTGLGQQPPASRGNVCHALDAADQPVNVAVIGAHGSEPSESSGQGWGVHLAQGAWDGSGARLFDVDLLILVACVVGRLRQDTDRDVQGLYARLAASGCRTAIAARWPIADAEAAYFVTSVIDEYLKLSEACDDASKKPFLRAQALNNARRECCGGNGPISDHLAAAFELYGRG